jgi:hypothetical protein
MVRRMPDLLLRAPTTAEILHVTKKLLPFVGEESNDPRHAMCQDPWTLVTGMHQYRTKELGRLNDMSLPEGWDEAVLQRMVVGAPALAMISGDFAKKNIAHLEALLGYEGMRQAVERDPSVTIVLPETRENALAMLRVRMLCDTKD